MMRVYVFLNVIWDFFYSVEKQLSHVRYYYFLMEYLKRGFNSVCSRIAITEFFETYVVRDDRL